MLTHDTKVEDKNEEKGTVAKRSKQAGKRKLFAKSMENHAHMHNLRVTDVLTQRERERERAN